MNLRLFCFKKPNYESFLSVLFSGTGTDAYPESMVVKKQLFFFHLFDFLESHKL